MSLHQSLAAAFALASLAGCQSYDIVQTNIFSNEDGEVLMVEYGHSERDHTNTFIAPTNGQEMEFKSKLVVKARFADDVPDFLEVLKRGTVTNRIELAGESFKAWQCMNFSGAGTMYKTDNEKWYLQANGFTCFVYKLSEQSGKHVEVYRGILCETPKSDYEPDDRWRKLKKDAKGTWK